MIAVNENRIVYSATDLVGYLECGHLSRLDRAQASGLIDAPFNSDPVLERIAKRGQLHERRFLDSLAAGGGAETEIAWDDSLSYKERIESGQDATLAAMRAGAEVIYQAVLFDGRRTGIADFLRRVDKVSDLGGWSYEVWDTKLARQAKASAVLQLCTYSDLVAQIQGCQPEHMHLALGGFAREKVSFRVADYAAYFRLVERSFGSFLETEAVAVPESSPDPVAHCDVCRWQLKCRDRWRADDDLALVANLDSRHRLQLREANVATRTGLAQLSDTDLAEIEGVRRNSLRHARDQAEIQVRGERAGKVISERLEPLRDRDDALVADHGLLMMPEPSGGDLFVDFEGDPFFESENADGIEYLFGVLEPGVTGAQGDPKFHAFWAIDQGTVTPAGERRAFERFIDLIVDRLEDDPDLHVYHFAPYEPNAVKTLSGRYGTREAEVDRLLRGRVFVDLYRTVRQGLRASVESYSIKRLEPLYGFKREINLREAGESIVEFETWLELENEGQREELRAKIERYNRDDCVSTHLLRDWLEQQRSELECELGFALPRPAIPEPAVTTDTEAQQAVNELADSLIDGQPAAISDMDQDQRGRWLLAQLLKWHRREDKGFWWRYFYLRDELSDSERRQESDALGELVFDGSRPAPPPNTQSTIYRFQYPPQDHALKIDSTPRDPVTGKSAGTIVAIDDQIGQIEVRRATRSPAPSPTSLIPFDYVKPTPKPESLQRLARQVLKNGIDSPGANRAGRDLLRRLPPRFGQGPEQPLRTSAEPASTAARRLATELDRSYLAIQGPPGSGKSTVGAEIIVDLVGAGKRIGVTANSHKVFGELLAKVASEAEKCGIQVRIGQRSGADDVAPGATPLDTKSAVAALRDGSFDVIGGTTWLWARDDVESSVDVLVIDEAGQMSMADALAASASAQNLVLLGDPQQLNQPLQGVHPPGAERSVLGHVLDGERVIPAHLGIFLDGSWRMHPDISNFTSEVFYEGQLHSHPGRERLSLEGSPPLSGTGVRFVPVVHEGHSSSSPEEAQRLAEMIEALLDSGATYSDADGNRHPIARSDILIITPYNAQVAEISAALPGFRVGTVDKFQGQQAPISIYSMATSSAAEAPRGMEFLYNLNRLNVATSRARCLAVVMGNRNLLQVRCRTPRQMRLANALARFIELAGRAT